MHLTLKCGNICGNLNIETEKIPDLIFLQLLELCHTFHLAKEKNASVKQTKKYTYVIT